MSYVVYVKRCCKGMERVYVAVYQVFLTICLHFFQGDHANNPGRRPESILPFECWQKIKVQYSKLLRFLL